MTGLVVYPLRLYDDCWIELRLPARLTQEDVKRIVAFLNTLPYDEPMLLTDKIHD